MAAESGTEICPGTDLEKLLCFKIEQLIVDIYRATIRSVSHRVVGPLVGNDQHNIHCFCEHKNPFHVNFQKDCIHILHGKGVSTLFPEKN